MRVEELCGFVMVVDAEDSDEDLPEGAYLVIPLPDTLDGAMTNRTPPPATDDVLSQLLAKIAALEARCATLEYRLRFVEGYRER